MGWAYAADSSLLWALWYPQPRLALAFLAQVQRLTLSGTCSQCVFPLGCGGNKHPLSEAPERKWLQGTAVASPASSSLIQPDNGLMVLNLWRQGCVL